MTNTTAFTIERRVTERDCFDPNCWTAHRRFVLPGMNGVHVVEEVVWTVIEEPGGRELETYDRRRDAVDRIRYETTGEYR